MLMSGLTDVTGDTTKFGTTVGALTAAEEPALLAALPVATAAVTAGEPWATATAWVVTVVPVLVETAAATA